MSKCQVVEIDGSLLRVQADGKLTTDDLEQLRLWVVEVKRRHARQRARHLKSGRSSGGTSSGSSPSEIQIAI
jgi:hypothetical protein